jgi:hypothetical protein
MRGRLIFPVTAYVRQLDTAEMDTQGEYDDLLREPLPKDPDGDGTDEPSRREKVAITIKVQVETNRDEMQMMGASGNISDSAYGLVPHMSELESLGLVDADGTLQIRPSDRLEKLVDKLGNVIRQFDRVPLYCTHAKRIDGWINGRSNLALLVFDERPAGVRG